MSYWLLEPSTFQQLAAARRDAAALSSRAEEYIARVEPREGQAPRNLTIAGSTAEIRVSGVLTKRPDFFAELFGGGNTTYGDIRASLAMAETNPAIKDVVLHIDSPGGSVDGFFDTLDQIANFRASGGKKLRVRAENAQSAAYGIAAVAGNVEAVGRGSTFGSIGTAVSYWVTDSIVELTNSDSPDKRPNLRTDEGKAVVVKYLDQLSEEFMRSIAQGRGVDLETVRNDFGRGASMTAVHAKRLGLIDKILTTAPRAVASKQGKAMSDDREDRAADRREIDAAVQRGIDQERDRVIGHLTMGEACGDLSIALEAIRSGKGMTTELQARYMSAGMNRSDRQRRQAESNAAEAALSGVEQSTPGAPDLADQVVAHLNLSGGKSLVVHKATKKGAA
jgi:ClpP class serine protease